MLSGTQRLRRPADISAVFGHGSVASTPAVVVRALHRPGAGGRAAVVAGRRLGRAVRRNRAKRRLRAALAEVGVPREHEVILIARPAALTVSFEELVRDVGDGIDRLTRSAAGGA